MAIDRSGVVDEAVWDRFRLHINQSDPWWPVVLQLRWIERLLAGDPGVAASEVAAALGSMDDASYNAFNKAIVCLSSASSVRARLVPGPGFERRLAELSEALTSPTAAPAAREEAVRLNAIFLLRDQVRSVGRVPIEPGQGGGGQPRDAAVAAARVELFARYSRLVVQLVPGLAGDTVITALVDLLGSYRELQTRAGVHGDADWDDLQQQRAEILESLGRACRILRRGPEALRWYHQARQAWLVAGSAERATACIARMADLSLLDQGDVDVELRRLLDALDATGEPAMGNGSDVLAGLSRAGALAALAALLLQVGDSFEARRRLDQASAALDHLGFGNPRSLGLAAAFAAWVEHAPAPTFFQSLADAISIWSSVGATAAALDWADRDASAQAGAIAAALGLVTEEMWNQVERAIAQLGPELDTLGVPPMMGVSDQLSYMKARTAGIGAAADLQRLVLDMESLRTEIGRRGGTGESRDDLVERAQRLSDLGGQRGAPQLAVAASIMGAELLVDLGRPAEALAVVRAARSALLSRSGFGAADHRAMSVDLLAREAACAGLCRDLAAVSDACGRGIAEVEQDRHKVSAPLLQDTYLQNKVNLYRWGVFAAWQLGDTETMLTRAELSKAHAGLGWLFRTDDEALAPDAGDSDLEREFARLSEQLNDASREAAARRRSAWDRLMMGRIRAGDGHSTVPRFSVGAVQSALGADEVVVYHYWLTEAALLVVTLDRTSVVAERKTLDDQTRGDLELLALHPETPEDFAGGGIDGLSALLLPVEGAPLLAGKDHLILSPHRLLHQLPLHALPFDGAPLIRRFAVTYVANLTSLLLAYPSTKAGGILALAVSDFSHVAADLPDLAGTVGEVEGICALYRAAGRAALVVGDRDASVAGFEAHCADRSFGSIHLATHASSIVSATPLESRLYLVDGVLDGLEIARLDIGAELIVLSACSAGQRAVFRRDDQGELAGDEVFGLQAAFFAAGARQVVGALWPVEDEVSSRVLTTFHRLLLGDRPPAVALQQAMLTELDRGSTRVEAWAPFHLVAMGRPG